MSKTKFPDAWDDDWEAQADKAVQGEDSDEARGTPAPKTRAERLAQHQESNRRLWESAESQEEFSFVPPSNNAPPVAAAATAFKPAMKVLSRRPAPQMIARRDPVTGMEQLTLQDDEGEEQLTKNQPTPEEIRLRQQREREEKQRRYDEARAKIFGEPKSSPSSGRSTPGAVTPPQSSDGRQNYRGRGRGRGAYRGDGQGRNGSQGGRSTVQPGSQPGARELFDPNVASKPGSILQKRGGDNGSPRPGRPTTPRDDDLVLRAPRGPDGSGRGGFGFARRDEKGT